MEKTLNTNHDLTEAQIGENYDYFIELLKEKFTGERLEKLLAMYSEDVLGITLATAPASSKANLHYAFAGGYLLHILNVEKASRGVQKVFEAMGGEVDFTDEERVFAAIHHDLGKLGDTDFGPYYLPCTDEWRMKKLGEIYSINKKSPPWDVTDRSLYMLQKYGIAVTWKETLAIKLSDGVFNEKNMPYFKSIDGLKTSLCNIIHWGDWIACRAEKSQWEQSQ